MAGPSVYLTLPSWDLFKFPPDPLPPTLPPPVRERSLRSPFGIQPWLFNVAMHPAVPFGFAAAYILIVLNVNAYNTSRNFKPWWISKQRLFKYFVVLHNIVLAIYSAATFLAMFRAIVHTLPDLAGDAGAAGVADALCKLHGPRVLGDAITYNTTINIWESKNQLIKLTGGNPDPTDLGRLWNEGLAFWGWIFYLSKFYEVVDTLIIVAKGKRSPTLQTYHHAGAMLCMWAGMRYMSPPIWMFVFVNSAIHAMMYVYFALAAMNIRVSQSVKRTLTTMQITQFLFGATYAGLHLFISYDIPIATPYKVAAKVAAVASSASSAYSSATSVVSAAIATPTVKENLGLFIKKLLLRAAGEEGVAERIGIPNDKPIAQAIESRLEEVKERVFHQPVYETRWRTEYSRVNCIDTSGEAFAIWLNLLYLAPLTVLFARFFVRSYLSRSKPQNAKQAAKEIAEDAKIAEAETERTVEEAGKRAEDVVRNRGSDVRKEIKSLHEQLKEDIRKMKKGDYGARKVSERISDFEKQVKEYADKAKEQALNTPRRGSPTKGDRAVDEDESHGSPGEHSSEKKKKKKNKNKNKTGGELGESKAESEKVEAADESEAKQDAVLAATEPVRPGADDDTDAMGQSGVGVEPSDPDAPSYAEVADPEK
ncbi:hypothetical protein AMS68_001876 [Peltaster fructicola]|uniref:Elongation of fatty acids protein n=1 Tax=Peltaster fructicola TaxID=286661 RepID=A0A6H0XP06_9PEZI|nr:hypothetical protein AMS68_001876 [Peltaster fructicola]